MPVDLAPSRVSADKLMASGNSAYLLSQLTIERQQRRISELEANTRTLEMEMVTWRTRFTSTQ